MANNFCYNRKQSLTTTMKYFFIFTILLFSNSISQQTKQKPMTQQHEKATFGGGCFWCIEAVFERLDGVDTVISGYAGGTTPNPSYKEVCTGRTGHAEVADRKSTRLNSSHRT